jgi:hypothetical protein
MTNAGLKDGSCDGGMTGCELDDQDILCRGISVFLSIYSELVH